MEARSSSGAVVVVQMEVFHEHDDWGANGGGQEKVLRSLVELGNRNRKKGEGWGCLVWVPGTSK
jgi:hypothetical protein